MGWMTRKRWQDEMQDRLAHQLSELRREVSSLGTSVARYGGQAQDDAGDLGEALWHSGEAVVRQLGREARRVGKAVREDPLPAIVAVVAVVGVVAALSLALSRE